MEPMTTPRNLPRRFRLLWRRPWSVFARRSRGFRRWLDANDHITPNFVWFEAQCADGTPVPEELRPNAIRHAWNLERLRHRLGDEPIPILSWYRHARHNAAIRGTRTSRHLQADATDHAKSWVDRIGRKQVIGEGEKVFRRGGMGRYPAGSVHFDSRGTKVRWTEYTAGEIASLDELEGG